MSEITPWNAEWDAPTKPTILSIQLTTTGLNYGHIILTCYYYLFHGFANVLKIKDFDLRFSHYMRVNCNIEQLNHRIEGNIISVWIQAISAASQIKLTFNCKNKTVIMTHQSFDIVETFGEIDPLKMEYQFGQEKLFKVNQ